MSSYEGEEKSIKKSLIKTKGLVVCAIVVLGFTFYLSGSAIAAFSSESGDTCAGLSAGNYHTCILNSDYNVHCYGGGGSIDYGQAIDYSGGDADGVSAGGLHTCILTSISGSADKNVHCYGNNDYGQAEDYLVGDAVGVSAGVAHTCILTSDKNVHCYGNNDYGQAIDYLGGDAVGVSAGGWHTCILTSILGSPGNVHCYGNNDYGQAIDYLGGDAVGVSAGGWHTCILKSDQNVHCYGDNEYGQAEDYSGVDAVGVSAGGLHTCILTSILGLPGNVHCYGNNDYGQAIDYLGGDAVGVSAGDLHTCILTSILGSPGNVHCYGYNYYGQANDYLGEDAICVTSQPPVGQPPVAKCKDVVAPTDPEVCSANASVDGGSYDPDGGQIELIQLPGSPYGLGITDVTLKVTNDKGASSSCTAVVNVEDVTPPVISSLSVSPDVLPRSCKMVPVTVNVSASDNCDAVPICKITSVSSNAGSARCSMRHIYAPDWEITGDLTVKLRAGYYWKGSWLVYKITVKCTDASGNSSSGTVRVTAPHHNCYCASRSR
jgi:hypothetical protein